MFYISLVVIAVLYYLIKHQFSIFLKLIHVGWVVGSIYLCFFQDYVQTESLLTRIFMFLLMGGYATYSLFMGISGGGFFDADDVGDDDGGGE